jgi:hypothetical protein
MQTGGQTAIEREREREREKQNKRRKREVERNPPLYRPPHFFPKLGSLGWIPGRRREE